jgi:hypothetical protein
MKNGQELLDALSEVIGWTDEWEDMSDWFDMANNTHYDETEPTSPIKTSWCQVEEYKDIWAIEVVTGGKSRGGEGWFGDDLEINSFELNWKWCIGGEWRGPQEGDFGRKHKHKAQLKFREWVEQSSTISEALKDCGSSLSEIDGTAAREESIGANEGNRHVFVVQFIVMPYEEDYFDIPKTLDDLNTIGSKLRTAAQESGVRPNSAWYFLWDGKAISLDDLASATGRGEEIIEAATTEPTAVKASENELYLHFSCVEDGGAEHWDSDFAELSRHDGFTRLRVFGSHSRYGPNVTQIYSCGELDTGGITRDIGGDPELFTVTPEPDPYNTGISLAFLDAAFYDSTEDD